MNKMVLWKSFIKSFRYILMYFVLGIISCNVPKLILVKISDSRKRLLYNFYAQPVLSKTIIHFTY